MSDSHEPTVTHEPGRSRFEIALDVSRVGLAAYLDDGDRRIFYHTEVDDAERGRGLAGTLVRTALTATRDAGRRIVPMCPYVRAWVDEHGGATGLTGAVDPVTREDVATVKESLR